LFRNIKQTQILQARLRELREDSKASRTLTQGYMDQSQPKSLRLPNWFDNKDVGW